MGGGNWVPANTYHFIENDETTDAAQNHYLLCKEIGIDDFIIFGGNYFTEFLPPVRCWLVWDKRVDIENPNNFADCEIAWCTLDKPSRIFRWKWMGLLKQGDRTEELAARIHPTQKPVGLFKDIIEWSGHNIYLDGFLGSGTTLIACERLHRKCRAVEISPAYCAVAIQRWVDITSGIPELVESVDIQRQTI